MRANKNCCAALLFLIAACSADGGDAPDQNAMQNGSSNGGANLIDSPAKSEKTDSDDAAKQAARASASPSIDFAGRFSSSYVGCGTGCVSAWFVDRKTGEVIEAPFGGSEDQMIDDMQTTADSNVVNVFYGSRDGLSDECTSQKFEWNGSSFEQLSSPAPAPCPSH